MRLFSLLLVAGLIVTATAGPSPLSNKEIALMLRSGYSSDAVLAEVTGRRVREAFDPAMKKSLIDFGANAQLISALASNAYLISGSEAGRAKQREAELSAQRATEIERSQELNTLYQAQQAEARAKAAAAPPSTGTLILDALKQKLVRCHDGTVSRAVGTELDNKKFVALYYSAHWCAPCRKFTPQLVDYYNRIVLEHPEFEIIFVSADRSRFGWETYIQEARMPWLAIDYDQLADLPGLKALGGDGIPSLLVLDGGSHIVASSYDGDKYLGPQNALAALDKIFAANAGPVAQIR
jgi:nucleoredoxin